MAAIRSSGEFFPVPLVVHHGQEHPAVQGGQDAEPQQNYRDGENIEGD